MPASVSSSFAEPPEDQADGLLGAMSSWSESDRAWVRRELAQAADRAPNRPEAAERHNQAAFRGGWPELADLARITVPALIVHGELDASIPVAHAHAFANGLADATATMISDMGHLPRPSDWKTIADFVVDHCGATPTG